MSPTSATRSPPGFETDEVVDVALRLDGGRLPVDHAHALSVAIHEALPWFERAVSAGLHLVHVAESGSGWQRPDGATSTELHVSRRTRLRLRVGAERAAEVLALRGRTLDVAGYSITVAGGKIVPLVPSATLLARHVICDEEEPESAFIPRVSRALSETLRQTLGQRDARDLSILCGRSQRIATPGRVLHTRSVHVSELSAQSSLALQRRGLGPGRKIGCGLFIAYKGLG